MKDTISDNKLEVAWNLIEVQKKLIALCYKMDKTEYTEKQLDRFKRLEDQMLDATVKWTNAVCSCDFGYIGKRYCLIHNRNGG